MRGVALLALLLVGCEVGAGEDAGVDTSWMAFGAPCNWSIDCEDLLGRSGLVCHPRAEYTCQPSCTSACRSVPERCCSNDRDLRCSVDEECGFSAWESVDLCTGSGVSSVGCPTTQHCYLTSAGVRRCATPCDPAEGPLCGRDACGPGLDDPASYVCLRGGPVEEGSVCTASAECEYGNLCAPTGVCARPCPDGICSGTRTCVDGFCVASE